MRSLIEQFTTLTTPDSLSLVPFGFSGWSTLAALPSSTFLAYVDVAVVVVFGGAMAAANLFSD